MAAIAQLKALLGLDTKAYRAGIKDAETRTQSFKSTLAGIGSAMASAFTVRAVYGAIEAITSFGSAISDAAEQAGLSVESYQAVKNAALEAGAPIEQITPMLSNLARAVGEARDGNKTYVDSLKHLGLTLEDINRLTIEEVLERVAQAMSKAERGSVEFAAGLEILGSRGGAKFIGVLKEIAKGLDNLKDKFKNIGLDPEELKTLDDASDSLTVFKERLKVFASQAYTAAVNAPSKVVDWAMGADLFGKWPKMPKPQTPTETGTETGTETEDPDILKLRKEIAKKENDLLYDRLGLVDQLAAKEQELAKGREDMAAALISDDEKRMLEIKRDMVDVEKEIYALIEKRNKAEQDAADKRASEMKKRQQEQDILTKSLLELKQKQEKERATETFSPRGTYVGQMQQMGGFVGRSRNEGVTIAERHLKLAQAEAKRVEELAEAVKKIQESTSILTGDLE